MEKQLDVYISRIIIETKQQIHPKRENPALPAERSYVVLDDKDLGHMIPNKQTDILINTHLPEFDQTIVPHRHTFYELVYVHKGILNMKINRKPISFSTGDFVLLNPSVIHQVSLGEEGSQVLNILMKRSLFNKSFFYMILDNQVFAEFILPSMAKQKKGKNYMVYPHAMQDNPMLATYLTNLLKEYVEGQSLSESALEINLSGLCLELARRYREKSKKPEGEAQQNFSIADICRYLSSRLTSATLEETASYFHYNPRYFSQILKKIYGKSFSGLLLELRMAYAAKLLAQTELPIKNIIQKSGYENTSYFYRVFQEIYGMKPGEYREQIKTAK